MTRLLPSIAVVLLASVAPGTSQAPPPRWQRPEGQARYTFKSSEQSPEKLSTVELQVALTVKAGVADVVTIERGRLGDGAAEPVAIQLSESCGREFGAREGTIGRIELVEGLDPAKLVPQCVPEGVFGAMTDLVSILLVQHKFFGIAGLKGAGDSARFPSFASEWSRLDPAVHARVAAPGGTTRVAALDAARAVIDWRPDPMDVVIARRVAPGMSVLLRGQERFDLEVTIDPRTGALLGARSKEDRLDLQVWPVQGAELPALDATPAGVGRPVTLVRTTSLTPAS